jgi:hypothetical protein
MRRLIALHGCLALLFALFMAPYQHVHPGEWAGQGPGRHFDDSAVVHAHAFLFSHVHADTASFSAKPNERIVIGDPSGERASWSLNNSSLVLHGAILLFIAPKSTAVSVLTAESFARIEIVEERGHDPPLLHCSAPRAPPA